MSVNVLGAKPNFQYFMNGGAYNWDYYGMPQRSPCTVIVHELFNQLTILIKCNTNFKVNTVVH